MKDLIPRIKALFLNPAGTWPSIESDPDTPVSLLKRLVLPMAAIPAVSMFIGSTLFSGLPLRYTLGSAVAQYVVFLAAVFVAAVLTDKLAPKFEGETNFTQSFKWVAWGLVPGALGGVFSIIPVLAPLGILAALFGLYFMYLGLPVMKKNPQERTLPYMAVVVIGGGIIVFVVAAIVYKAVPSPVPQDLREALELYGR